MKRTSEKSETRSLKIGDEVLIDSGRIVWTIESFEEGGKVGAVATVVQRSNIVGALKYAPIPAETTIKGARTEPKVSRKIDIYRLTKVEG